MNPDNSSNDRSYASGTPPEVRMLVFSLLEKIINGLGNLDPGTQEKLEKLDGKTITMDLTDLGQQLTVTICGNELILIDEPVGTPDTLMRIDAVSLFRLLRHKGSTPVNVKMELEGDIASGQLIKEIFDSWQVDWEEHLSHLTGDVFAHQATRFLTSMSDWLQTQARNFGETVAEYVTEEKPVVARALDLENFATGVDRLRDDVSRLEARLRRLHERMNEE